MEPLDLTDREQCGYPEHDGEEEATADTRPALPTAPTSGRFGPDNLPF